MTELRIGTSGYVYRHWKDVFYPTGLPAKRWFEYYSNVFSTVELNTTFYHLPRPTAVARWRKDAPTGFVFACKGSRFITHMKRLREPRDALARYFEIIGKLGPKLGPILWQLPPQMNKADLPRLENFLALLPKRYSYAIEFRSDAWYTEEVCTLLDRHEVALCEHDLLERSPPRFTGNFRYLRFHGKTGKYQGRYGKRALKKFAQSLLRWKGSGRSAYVFFNNDIGGHAISDALDLLELTSTEELKYEWDGPKSLPHPPS